MEEQANLLAVILRSANDPTLNRSQLHRVARAARAHQAYIRQRVMAEDSDDDEGPEDEDGWLFEDLAVLIRLYARLRDREQMIELVFEVRFPIPQLGIAIYHGKCDRVRQLTCSGTLSPYSMHHSLKSIKQRALPTPLETSKISSMT